MKCPMRNDGKGRFGECMENACAWYLSRFAPGSKVSNSACAVLFMVAPTESHKGDYVLEQPQIKNDRMAR